MHLPRSIRNPWAAAIGIALLAAAATACDEEKKPDAPDAVATTAPAVPTIPPPVRMPEVTLTATSVQAGIDDLQIAVPSFDAALKRLIEKYPVSTPEVVVLNADRKVSTPLAIKIAYALFDAGAKAIEVRTKPRGSFPGALKIQSDKQAGKVPPCAFAATIQENFGVAFWPVRGGQGKRYSKGMAGPDLSAMHEVFAKDEASCTSTVFFFSADATVEWGHAYDLATSVVAHEPHYKIQTIVLLHDEPAAGKPVKLPDGTAK